MASWVNVLQWISKSIQVAIQVLWDIHSWHDGIRADESAEHGSLILTNHNLLAG
jgi:hypothetical protein